MNMLALLLILAAASFPNPQSESWIDSAEAYFVTEAERSEWTALPSREARDAFKDRYWLRRDPTPGTPPNEFRDTILGRIQYADETFRIEDTPGSRTSRGFLFIVFGSPARAKQDYLSTVRPGQRGMIGENEGTETIFLWTWDRERTPELLKVLGLPRFEVTVILEPNRRRDRIENPGLANQFRDLLAEKSIVNPDLVAPEMASAAPEMVPLLPPTGEEAWRAASQGPAAPSAAGSAVVFTPEGAPKAVLWGFDEGGGTSPTVALRLAREGDANASVWSGPAAPTHRLIASRPGTIWIAALELPEGTWDGEIDTSLTAAGRLQISIPAAGEFAVSSLLLGGGPETDVPADPLFAIGPALFRPRADGQFSPGESLWYFLQFRGTLPEGARLEPRLMKKGKGVITVWQPAAPELVQAGPNLQVAGYEIPLQSFEPGSYTLYVTLRAGEQSFVRRSDFEIVQR